MHVASCAPFDWSRAHVVQRVPARATVLRKKQQQAQPARVMEHSQKSLRQPGACVKSKLVSLPPHQQA